MYRKRLKVPYISQSEHSECALACIAMLINALGGSVTLDELRVKYGVSRGGLNLLQVKKVLADYGLATHVVKANKISELCDFHIPSILHWNNNHFVVLERCSSRKFHVVDPASGRHSYTLDEMNQHCSGVSVIPERVSAVLGQRNGRAFLSWPMNRLLRLLLLFARKSSVLVIGTVLLAFMVQTLTLIIPTITRFLIDNQAVAGSRDFILYAVLMLLLSFAVYYAVDALDTVVVTRLQIKFGRYLFTSYMSGVLSRDFSFFVNRSSSDFIYRANLIMLIDQALTGGLINTLVSFVFLVVYFAMMLSYSPVLTLLTILVCVLILMVSLIYARRSGHLAEYETLAQSEVQQSFLEIFSGIETVKSLNLERYFYRQWNKKLEHQLYYQAKRGKLSAALSSLSAGLIFILPLVIVVFGVVLVHNGAIGLGTVVGFITLANAFASPFSSIVNAIGQFVTLGAYMRKVIEVLPNQSDQNQLSIESRKYSETPIGPKEYKLENITADKIDYSYTVFDRPVLQEISLKVMYGAKIAIVGPTGSGKSTFLKILAGLIQPSQGSVLVNSETPIQSLDRSYLMDKVAFVNQAPTVFNETLRDNILLHRSWISEAQLSQVCKLACIDERMTGVAGNLDVMLSENGMNLSGGQKQKVTIARALAGSPDYLLMDEPTSALDNETEQQIMSGILELPSACVVVAHRLVSIRGFDKIYVMNNGKIVESGTHSQLLTANGLYRKLYRKQ